MGISSVGVDHVLITRFNLPSSGYEQQVRVREGWLEERVTLFEKYCLPSVVWQTVPSFHWIIYFDPGSPAWLKQRIAGWSSDSRIQGIFRAQVSRPELLSDLRRVSGARHERLLTTNLDNDDALAVDFVERVQAVEPAHEATAIYLADGLISSTAGLYTRTDRVNAFCSVSTPWSEAKTCWAEWHNRLGRTMPVCVERGDPAWLQVVHGRNVSNRVHGVLTDPSKHASAFPGLLDHMPDPTAAMRFRDAVIDQPIRLVRDVSRGMAKQAIVLAAGRAALERVRSWMS